MFTLTAAEAGTAVSEQTANQAAITREIIEVVSGAGAL